MIGRAYDGSSTDEVGERFQFAVLKTMKTLFEAFGLMADAQYWSVEFGLTSDGCTADTHTLSCDGRSQVQRYGDAESFYEKANAST